MGFAAPHAQQLDQPALASQTFKTRRWRWMGRHAPAGGRGVGFAGVALLGGVAPTPDDQRRDARLSRAKLQAARSVERNARDFSHDPGKPLAMKPLFHRGKNVAVLPRLAIDDAVRMQADTRERRREKIAPAQAPKHRPRNPRQNTRGEQRGEAGVLARGPTFRYFVQMAQLQAAAGQVPVKISDTKGQSSPYALGAGNAFQLLPEFGERVVGR